MEAFDVWHDGAVFHFLAALAGRVSYRRLLLQTIPVGGHALIRTFAFDGPEKCSGLEVRRYDGPMLAAELGPQFALLKSKPEIRVTPWGKRPSFQYRDRMAHLSVASYPLAQHLRRRKRVD